MKEYVSRFWVPVLEIWIHEKKAYQIDPFISQVFTTYL